MMVCRHGTAIIEFHGSPPNYCYAAQGILHRLNYFGSVADTRSKINGEIYAGIDDAINIIENLERIN